MAAQPTARRPSTSSSAPAARPPALSLARLVPLLLCSSAVAFASPLGRLSPAPVVLPEQSQRVLGGGAADKPDPSPRRLHGKFLHITDMHFDAFYKAHSSTAEDAACHRGKGVAGVYGAETSDCDTPASLINATFDWIAANLRDEIDFVVWTGDSARHDSDELIPRSTAEIQDANQAIADKFVAVFDDPSGQGLVVPIVPTLGNNDILPHNVLLPGPNKWLKRYTDIWRRFIPQEQRHSFEFGGWFYVEVIPNRLAVFSLNTLYFFDRNAGVDDCVGPSEPGFKQLEWLRIQLQFMRERGVKALLMGHVPPARTGSKQLWDETCWQKYTLWLRQFRDVVVGSMYGHMNIDHFLLHDTEEINYALLGTSREEVEGAGDEDEDDDDGEDGKDDEDDEDDEVNDTDGVEPDVFVRATLESELDVRSTADYLQELRSEWSKLPKPQVVEADGGDGAVSAKAGKKKKKKNKKKKKQHGPKLPHKWAERYQLSLVSPSVVPNYLPSLRVIQYNITGLEDAPVWTDGPSDVPVLAEDQLLLLSGAEETAPEKGGSNKKKKNNKDKKKDKKKKKDPNLTVPSGPAKTAPPGPAYSSQPLTLLGYTQYFANLTYINNDITTVGGERSADHEVGSDRWREGEHSDKEPDTAAKPHAFQYDVEYSTFTDKIYNLTDLTVTSFLRMAYRMGRKTSTDAVEAVEAVEAAEATVGDSAEAFGEDDAGDSDSEEDVDGLDRVDDAGKKKRKKKKKEKENEVWLHFLRHAFVSSISKGKLKKISK